MKNKALKIINPILFVLFALALVAMVLMQLELGSRFIYNLHVISGGLFFALGIVHLILNWGWVRNSFFKRKATKKK